MKRLAFALVFLCAASANADDTLDDIAWKLGRLDRDIYYGSYDSPGSGGAVYYPVYKTKAQLRKERQLYFRIQKATARRAEQAARHVR